MIDSVSEQANSTDFRAGRQPRSLQQRGAAALDRLPPHDLQMEMGVLGCCLLSPHECLNECITQLKSVGKEAFYNLRHQEIYQTLVTMRESNAPIDLITIRENLMTRQMLDQVGGIAYISQIQDGVPSAANLSWYLEKVKEKFVLRRMIETCTGVVGRIYEFEGDVDSLLDETEKEILAVGNIRRSVDEIQSSKELVQESINEIEKLFNRKGALGGLPTGFPDLDRMTDGLHGGDMVVIAARPSMGKTSMALNIAEHVVLESKVPVGIFSLEMSALSLMMRMKCSVARVNLRKIQDGFMSEGDFPRLMSAAGKLSKAPLHIDATAGLSIMQLRARARRMAQKYGIKLFIIDYLQLLHTTNKRAKNRQEEIADISSGIKQLAKELNVPIIVLAQLSRDIEKDNKGKKKRKPRMSDLRESGAIEQDADLVGILYNPNATEDEDESEAQDQAEALEVNLLIAKQRNGPTGTIKTSFLKPFCRFESAARFAACDVPNNPPPTKK